MELSFSAKKLKNTGFLSKSGVFYGCGGRTRTYDLRVMSPTSFQLLYSAMSLRSPECLDIVTRVCLFVKHLFYNFQNIFGTRIYMSQRDALCRRIQVREHKFIIIGIRISTEMLVLALIHLIIPEYRKYVIGIEPLHHFQIVTRNLF